LNGALDIISTLDSNVNDQSDPTSLDVPIDHDWDFRANAYYLYVTVFRADDASRPRFFRAEISTFEAPPENEPPEAAFSFETDGLTANFTDESTDSDGEVVAWSWAFGDDNTSTEQNPPHTYADAGTYTVTLTVTDDQEAVSEPVEVEVEVTDDGCEGEVTFWPSDLNPGDQYHVVFITDDSQSDGTSGDIADYNAYVQDQAEWPSALTENWCVQWFAIASTEAVEAKNNVPVDSAPVYLFGSQGSAIRVADDAADLWDGSIQNTISTDQFNGQNGGDNVWTGTASDGTGFPDRVMGTTSPRTGWSGAFTDGEWVSFGISPGSTLYQLYAVSEVLTVPAE
jgi:PKD repeat protein